MCNSVSIYALYDVSMMKSVAWLGKTITLGSGGNMDRSALRFCLCLSTTIVLGQCPCAQ
jgi:hypothetical protein